MRLVTRVLLLLLYVSLRVIKHQVIIRREKSRSNRPLGLFRIMLPFFRLNEERRIHDRSEPRFTTENQLHGSHDMIALFV